MDTLGAAAQAQAALKDGAMPEGKLELSFGASHSKSTFTEDSTQHNGNPPAFNASQK